MSDASADMLGSVFSETLIDVIRQVSGFSLRVLSTEPDASLGRITGVMNLDSKKRGVLLISADTPDARALCSFITGVAEIDVTKEDIDDTLCELANITAGNVKLRLKDEDYIFSVSAPFVITGENVSLVTKKRTCLISRQLGDGVISVMLRLIY